MKRIHMLSAVAALALAGPLTSIPASAIPPKSFIAPGAEAYKFDLAFGESGALPDQFGQPEGIDIDGQGNVWVADTNNHRVVKYDANGNLLFSFGSYGTTVDGTFYYPRHVAVDAKRNAIWVTDYNSRVQRFDLKGKFLCKNTTTSTPRGIAVRASNGYAYVVSSGNASVFRMTPECQVNATYSQGAGSADGQFSSPIGIAVDVDGNYYVADTNNHRIQKFTPNGAFITKIGVYGSGDGRYIGSPQFYSPAGVDIDASGDLLITDLSNQRIQKIRPNGEVVQIWGWYGTGRGQLYNPIGLAADAIGRVFVADKDNGRVVRFSPSPSSESFLPLDPVGTAGSGNGQFNSPGSVSVNQDTGFFYVADQSNHRVEVFAANGNFQNAYGSYGTGNAQFNVAAQVAVDPLDGSYFVTDRNNHRVEKFSSNGAFLKTWGAQGTGKALFYYPEGIAVDPVTHDVYVADQYNHRVQRFTQTGAFVMGIGNGTNWGGAPPAPVAGAANSQFNYPLGVAVDSLGNLYVADTSNHRVQKFDADGNFVTRWGTGTSGAGKGQFSSPTGIAVDANDDVYVTDGNHRVQRFRSDGRFVEAFGSYSASAPVPPGLFYNPTGMAFSPNNNVLYVADRSNNRIQRFERFAFKVTAAPTSKTVVQGVNAKFTLTAKLLGGNTLDTKVAFKVLSGLPAGSTGTFSLPQVKPSAAGADSELTVTTSAGTAAKTYKITVEIEGGGQTRLVTVTLKVTEPV